MRSERAREFQRELLFKEKRIQMWEQFHIVPPRSVIKSFEFPETFLDGNKPKGVEI